MKDARWQRLETIAREEVAGVQRELPNQLRTKAVRLPVRFERDSASSPAARDLGDDLLGLFVGPDIACEEEHGSLPPQIILFLESLWDFSGGHEEDFREEIRATYLHELGHYLGLDEDEVEERGL